MAGTIQSAYATSPSGGYASAPVSVGDTLTWTVQYDPHTPGTPLSLAPGNLYPLAGPLISNLVDQTNGFRFSPPPAANLTSDLVLPSSSVSGGDLQTSRGIVYQTELFLVAPANGFATLNLSQLPLDQAGIPMTDGYDALNQLTYYSSPGGAGGGSQVGLNVHVTSLSAVSTPEPASLTLFLLGTAGFAV